MSDEKLEPIVFLLPANLRGREFAVAFDVHIKDINNAFAVDMETIKLKPKLGTELLLDGDYSVGGHRMELQGIEEYKP